MSNAAEIVRAMDSGAPPALWRRLSYMVVQVAIDESGNSPNQEVIVLGGVIAKAKSWVKFAREWGRILRELSLDEVKYGEITRMQGPFSPALGWTRASRDQLFQKLVGIIASHAIGFVGVAVRHDDFNQHLRSVTAPYRNLMTDMPNVLMAGSTILPTLALLDEARVWDICDFYFDECPGHDALITEMWPEYRQVGEDFDFSNARGGQRVEIGIPHFPSSCRFVPLQAADLIAGLIRAQELGRGCHAAFGQLDHLPSLIVRLNEAHMLIAAKGLSQAVTRVRSRFPNAPLYGFDKGARKMLESRRRDNLAKRARR
jgi:hypothetical protein